MSAHTSGPWEARPKRGDTDSWWVTATPPHPGHRGFLAECVARKSENEANARLVAAAPDLLKALLEIREAVCSGMGSLPPDDMERAQLAIEKAQSRGL